MGIRLRKGAIYLIAVAYLVVPTIIFFYGWLRWELSVLCIFLLGVAVYRTIKEIDIKEEIIISKSALSCLMISSFALVILSGIGGTFTQSYDIYMRNAIYRDLVLYEWPVYYPESNGVLVYYFGYWLPPALLCKIILPLMSEYQIWIIANIVLIIYSTIGIILVLLLVMIMLYNSIDFKKAITVLLIFSIWGPLSIIGWYLFHNDGYGIIDLLSQLYLSLNIDHYVNWFGAINGNYLELCNVYNQCIPAWIASMLFLLIKEQVKIYGLVCLSLCISAPFPVVGLFIIMILWYTKLVIKGKISVINGVSVINILSMLLLFIFVLFYSGNRGFVLEYREFPSDIDTLQLIFISLLFCLLSFGAIAFLIRKSGDSLFNIVIFTYLLLIVASRWYPTNDFMMRATIPCSIYLMVITYKKISESKFKIEKGAIIALLAIMSLPIYIYIYSCFVKGIFINDHLYTLNGYLTGYCKQYIKFFPHQDNFFNKLSNLSEFEYANLIQYDEDNFVKNVVIDVGNIHEASSLTNISEEKIKKDMKHLYKDKYFYEGDNDVMKDCVITDDLDTDELDFYWTNEHFYFSRFYTILSVKLYNKSPLIRETQVTTICQTT